MPLSIPKFEITNGIGEDDFNSYARNGYLIIKRPFDMALIEKLAQWTRTRFFDESGKLTTVRAQDEWRNTPEVKALACNKFVIEKLKKLYGREPIPFQTLNFPIGTHQNTHSDTVHFHSFPQRWMCGVWVALEDIDENKGPLHYYPGSHRLPVLSLEDVGVSVAKVRSGFRKSKAEKIYQQYELAIQELIELSGIEKKTLCIEKGDMLIWSANLLHGGDPILKHDSTRFSQVTHYYFEGCKYYTPLTSDLMNGKIEYRNNIVNIASA
ncbi:MAG: phytanoyl-CoA dioxygenase family protein [Gammaproteobacteria bacterium]